MKKLFNNLMKLSESSDSFYYKDITSSMLTECRLFSYRFIPPFSSWLLPDAIESRGILFEIKDGKPIKVLARPMAKFFNLNENEFTQEKDLNLETAEVHEKADGSLISIYLDKGVLTCKSNVSLFSDQASAATMLLYSDEYEDFYNECLDYASSGFTINCEYTAPDNQIVIFYDKHELLVLNVRDNNTGEYVFSAELEQIFEEKYLKPLDKKFSHDMYNETDKEGYVLVLESGQRIKIKTLWYLSLHRMKDQVMSDTRIIDCILDESIDDIIPLLNGSPRLKRKVEITTNFISTVLFTYYSDIMSYYVINKHKTRKAFATGFNMAPYLMNPLMKLYEESVDSDGVINILKTHIKKYNTKYSNDLLSSGLLKELDDDKYGNGDL